MTDTHEAVRLANEHRPSMTAEVLHSWAVEAAALLRRIPELEAELEAAKLGEATHDRQATEYAHRVAHWIGKFDEVKAERDQLRNSETTFRKTLEWIVANPGMHHGNAVAQAVADLRKHPATPPHADQKGQ